MFNDFLNHSHYLWDRPRIIFLLQTEQCTSLSSERQQSTAYLHNACLPTSLQLSASSGHRSNQRTAGRVRIPTASLDLRASDAISGTDEKHSLSPCFDCNYIFTRVRKIAKKRILASSCLSVRLSDWNKSATNVRIFMKFDI